MRYSIDMKQSLMERLLRPDGPKVPELSRETGIQQTTLYRWLQGARMGAMQQDGAKNRKGSRTLAEKQALLLESRGLTGDDLGRWLRTTGIHAETLELWKAEIETALGGIADQSRREAEFRGELSTLQKEIRRKDKALAEMTALVVLKKKWRRCSVPRNNSRPGATGNSGTRGGGQSRWCEAEPGLCDSRRHSTHTSTLAVELWR